MTRHSMRFYIATVGLLLALSASTALGQAEGEAPTPPGETVLLRYQPPVGWSGEYIFDLNARFDVTDRIGIQYDRFGVVVKAKVSQKVTETRPDGSVLLETTSQILEMEPDRGDDYTPVHSLITVDERHRMIEIANVPGQEPMADTGWETLAIQIMNGLSFPEAAVKIGDRWEGKYELAMPQTDEVVTMGVKGQLTERLPDGTSADGDRWVSLVSSELQIPLRVMTGDTLTKGNVGIHLRLEIFEDTGELRYVRAWGRGSAKPDLAIRVAKFRIRVNEMHFRRVLDNGELLPSIKGEEE